VTIGDGNNTSFRFDVWLLNGKTIREQIQVPLTVDELKILVADIILEYRTIGLSFISFELTRDIVLQINSTYITKQKIEKIQPSGHQIQKVRQMIVLETTQTRGSSNGCGSYGYVNMRGCQLETIYIL